MIPSCKTNPRPGSNARTLLITAGERQIDRSGEKFGLKSQKTVQNQQKIVYFLDITLLIHCLFSYIFLGFFVFTEYLCRPSEASTRYCAILGSNPPKK